MPRCLPHQAAPQDWSRGQGCSGAGGGPAARSWNQEGGCPRPPGRPFLEAFGCAFPWEMRTFRGKKKLTKKPQHCIAEPLRWAGSPVVRARSHVCPGAGARERGPGLMMPRDDARAREGPEGQGRLLRLHFPPRCLHPRGHIYLKPVPLPESPSSSFLLLLPQKGPASWTVHPLPAPQAPRATGGEGTVWSPRPHLWNQQGPQAPSRDLTRPAGPGRAPAALGQSPPGLAAPGGCGEGQPDPNATCGVSPTAPSLAFSEPCAPHPAEGKPSPSHWPA